MMPLNESVDNIQDPQMRDVLVLLASSLDVLQEAHKRNEVYRKLETIYYNPNKNVTGYRHFYSDIFIILMKIKNGEYKGTDIDTLAVNKTKYSSIPYEKVQETDSKIIKIIAKETGMSENEEVVKNYRIGGFVLPYAVKDKDTDRAKTVIDINDIETFNGKTAYRGLIYRKNMFEGMGYKYKLLNMADYI